MKNHGVSNTKINFQLLNGNIINSYSLDLFVSGFYSVVKPVLCKREGSKWEFDLEHCAKRVLSITLGIFLVLFMEYGFTELLIQYSVLLRSK